MKKIYTSNYARNGNNPDAYAISVYGPKWYNGKTLSFLAPRGRTVMDYKKGIISENEYVNQYINHITKNGTITAQELVDRIPDGAILLCYESVHEFCHRRVFAEWIYIQTGIEILELLNPKEQKQALQQDLVDSLISF